MLPGHMVGGAGGAGGAVGGAVAWQHPTLQVKDMQGQSMAGMLGLALPSNGFDLEGR